MAVSSLCAGGKLAGLLESSRPLALSRCSWLAPAPTKRNQVKLQRKGWEGSIGPLDPSLLDWRLRGSNRALKGARVPHAADSRGPFTASRGGRRRLIRFLLRRFCSKAAVGGEKGKDTPALRAPRSSLPVAGEEGPSYSPRLPKQFSSISYLL